MNKLRLVFDNIFVFSFLSFFSASGEVINTLNFVPEKIHFHYISN